MMPRIRLTQNISFHDKLYNGSIYIQYLPMVNPADRTLYKTPNNLRKNYKDDFWHALFMSNHMNQTPDHFIRGIRGRTLWHNEYRSNLMYKSVENGDDVGTKFQGILGHVDFPAGFQTNETGLAPFHGNTCDSCHVRNGSGIPLMPNGKLPLLHFDDNGNPIMKADYHVRTGKDGDYTYTNKTYPTREVPSMKMVFFDLGEPVDPKRSKCDDNDHTVPKGIDFLPLEPASSRNRLYSNKIMNFFGNSLQLNQNDKKLTYGMKYVAIAPGDGFEVVDKTLRRRDGNTQKAMYRPARVQIDASQIKAADVCSITRDRPKKVSPAEWPSSCADVSGKKINEAIKGGDIGFMHLLGRRLGNTPLIELIPDAEIRAARKEQAKTSVPGCISLAPGTRWGTPIFPPPFDYLAYNYRNCSTGKGGQGPNDCYIGRWGWIGDRASLEDQIANAAHVEMNVSSSEGYGLLHPFADDEAQLVRYEGTLCGPANASCDPEAAANSDITEQEIRDMATYQRWIGIPNRSEYQVSSEKVQEGEKIFNELQCSSCHVIKKIAFEYDDNMLPDEERDHLKKLEILREDGVVGYPFISYLGTDLLMHDMGYLSQVASAPARAKIRKRDGRINPKYQNYAQYIRTPALKGLRFNRFVTDSNHNRSDSTTPLAKTLSLVVIFSCTMAELATRSKRPIFMTGRR
jgi:hypothetical protein